MSWKGRSLRDISLGVRSLLWPLGIFVLALGVRLYSASLMPFPALDDPTFYLKVAENLAQGKGLVIDAIWSYQFPFPSVSHPSNEYWMPLTSMILAPFFRVLGSSFRVAQVVGALAGAALAMGTYYLALAIWAEEYQGKTKNWLAIGVAILVAFNSLLVYQSATADSAVFFSLLTFLGLFALGKASDWRAFATAGALGGLSYLTRSDGILFLFPLFYRYIKGRKVLRGLVVALIAWGVVVGPWLLRNWTALGTPLPVSFKAAALAQEYPDLFRYLPQREAQGGTWTPKWKDFLKLRVKALYHNAVGVLNFALYPWAVLGLLGLFTLRERPLFQPAIIFILLLFFVTALVFPVPAMAGTYYHSVGATLPFLAVAGVYTIKRGSEALKLRLGFVVRAQPNGLRREPFPVFYLGILAVTLVQLAWSQGMAAEQHKAWEAQFSEIARWLEEHPEGTVMTTQPHTIHYVSGRPTVMLPAKDPPEVVLEAAKRYGVKYLVITEPFSLYPRVLKETPQGPFRRVYSSRAAEIYEILP